MKTFSVHGRDYFSFVSKVIGGLELVSMLECLRRWLRRESQQHAEIVASDWN